jgi:class 3 adenylate cyclase
LQERVAQLNQLRARDGLPTTHIYVALHIGEVFYGNIGSDERLDFTVVGPAVNEVARIAAMCRSVERDVLLSQAFANPWQDWNGVGWSPSAVMHCAASSGRRSCSRSIRSGLCEPTDRLTYTQQGGTCQPITSSAQAVRRAKANSTNGRTSFGTQFV